MNFLQQIINQLLDHIHAHPIIAGLIGAWLGVTAVALEVGWQVKIREDTRLGVDTGRGLIGMAGSGISGLKRLLSGEAEDGSDWNGSGKGRLGRVVDGFMVDAVRKSRVTIFRLNPSSRSDLYPSIARTFCHCDSDSARPQFPPTVIISPPSNPLLLPLLISLLKSQYVVLLGLKELEEVEEVERVLKGLSAGGSSTSSSAHAGQGGSLGGKKRGPGVDLMAGVWVGVLDVDDVSRSCARVCSHELGNMADLAVRPACSCMTCFCDLLSPARLGPSVPPITPCGTDHPLPLPISTYRPRLGLLARPSGQFDGRCQEDDEQG